jgi:hypothetical protein
MAVNDVVSQLQLLLKGVAPLIETGGETGQAPVRLTPGQQVQARVLDTLPNGRFLVLVDDRQLDLNLPRNTQPGDTVTLRFVANQPRPTFILGAEGGLPQARAGVTLSDTARFIGALLNKADALASQEAGSVVRNVPVLSGAPPADSQQFATALRSALSQSGLFYESHQAQWVAGQRSLGALLQEPQAQLSEPRAFAAAAQEQASSAQATRLVSEGRVSTPPAGGSTLPQPPTQVSDVSSPGGTPLHAAAARDSAGAESVHPGTATLVQQQLEALDSRQVVWQGQIWPGQTMHWEIEERDAREGGGADDQREWQTRLALTLPQMGEVGALLRISAQGIHLEVTAASAQTAQRLGAATDELRAGFERADLRLAQLVVKQDG